MTEIEQGSPEWHQLRLGKLTASRIADATTRLKSGGWGASRASYMGELIAERLTGVPFEAYVSAAMKQGTELEPEARAAYEYYESVVVEKIAFIDHPAIAMSGASPDGFVGRDGLVELKCPLVHTHIATLLGDSIDGNYIKQMQWQMACSGRKWCDWVSYSPKLPERMRLFVKRVPRDDKMIAGLEEDAKGFLWELDKAVMALRNAYGETDAATAA
jgi:putative phage-type endonuclease